MLTERILVGDCRAQLATLPEECVQTVVTSPPCQLSAMVMRRRVTGSLGLPVDAEAWAREHVRERQQARKAGAGSGSQDSPQ